MKDLFTIIVHFGDPKTTNDCIEGIQKYTKVSRIIVVNNDTTSDLTFLKKNKNVIIFDNKKNVGFARGVNIGINYAIKNNARYVLLLNNDTVISSDFVSPLVLFLRNNMDAGIVGPVIKFKKNGVVNLDFGGKVNLFFGKTKHDNRERFDVTVPFKVAYVSGCCMLIKSEVIKNVGILDGQYFLYYEDVDYCLRAKERGYSTYVEPNSLIYHHLSEGVGKNSEKAIYYQTKSAMLFGKKWVHPRFLNVLFVFFQSCIFFSKNLRFGKSVFSAFFTSLF